MAWARKLPSGRWQGHYRDRERRVRSIKGTFTRKADALTEAQEQESQIRHGRWTDPKLGRILFGTFGADYMATAFNQRPTTRARNETHWRTHLEPTFGSVPLASIEPIQVQRFVTELSGRRAPGTVVIAYQLLARIMAAAEETGYIARTPCRGVRLPRTEQSEMRFLEASELERLAAAVQECHRALVLAAGYLGLRWGEACGLKRTRLNLLKGTLDVSEVLLEVRGTLSFGEPKTKASRRRLSLPPFLVGELEAHLERYSTHPGSSSPDAAVAHSVETISGAGRGSRPSSVLVSLPYASTISGTRPRGCLSLKTSTPR